MDEWREFEREKVSTAVSYQSPVLLPLVVRAGGSNVHPLLQLEAEAYRLDSVITAAVASVDSQGSSYPSQESVGVDNDTDAVPLALGAAGSNLAEP